ncbi:hypothetical protein SAMN04488126_11252 [Bhargavaea beijingensis]|uniref:Uncharacterized protein n=1 Tax=Bhargavaea beijingensis TaxID=426756 RepID=A0A1G7E4N1_9BACL|nr:hypothetical protein [Bhargavaea beijingensis]SDE58315.1 hypothetical protein SAMN04488126_11252 [Bhargavaea beijingensis]
MTAQMTTIGILVSSLGAGAWLVALLSDKKGQLSHAISIIADFLIFLWASKLALNVHHLIREPVAVLSRPADSAAFYTASLLTGIILVFRIWRDRSDPGILLFLLRLWFLSSFLFEFTEFVIGSHPANLINLFLYGGLSLFSVRKALPPDRLMVMSLLLWAAGGLSTLLIQPVLTMFGFLISPWIFLMFTVMAASAIKLLWKEGTLWT